MPRLINVYHQKKKILLDNYENVDIIDINNIINYSADFIKFDHLQLLNHTTSLSVLSCLINKLKLGGKILIGISNIKLISRMYADNILTDDGFLENIKDCHSIWSIDFLQDTIGVNHADIQITNIQYNNENHHNYITIERKSL